jgi:uncharacterized OB-fold protein
MNQTSQHRKEFNWNVDFEVNLGDLYGEFFEGLKDKRILARECPECDRTFMPPQPHCDHCFVETEGWTELEQEGELVSFTVTYRKFLNMPEPPYVTGIVRVDDSDTCMLHFVDPGDFGTDDDITEMLNRGDKVRPVWADERTGDIQDISHFEVVE